MKPTSSRRTRTEKKAEKLAEYRAKRDLSESSEPRAADSGAGGSASSERSQRFVVQEHSATRLHWDLRLEHDGVAVSWAIPNGIPEVPGENRLAVHTEDHPLEYLSWEGEIPKGHYGAGTMKVWDSGTYEAREWTDRKATVVFHGKRVEGTYHLFHIGPEEKDWMIRRRDPPADPERVPMPAHVAPVLAVAGPLPEEDAAFEIQLGGRRAFAYCEPGRIRVEDLSGRDISDQHPELSRLPRQIGAHSAVLDGELVRAGRTRFYEIFDLVYLDGRSLVDLPWRERRARLEELGLEGPSWRVSHAHLGDGAAVLAAAREQGLPGIVAKPLESRYAPGARWIAVEREPRVDVGHPERVLYPSSGFTKLDLAAYYRAVAPVVLPHVCGRPLSMRRYFHGVDGPKRWEKECPPQAPDWLTRVEVPSEAKGRPIRYCAIDSEDALLWSANHANVELHVTLALGGDIQRPTALVFDLDPGEPAGMDECAEVALLLHGMFEALDLESFAKTTGSKGLQVYVPLNSDTTYEQTKPFARQVAELLAARAPEVVTANMAKSERRGKVLVDWSQNEWHKSTVCAYSLRARERPTVSTPVTWDEVASGELDFDHAAVLERIARHGDLFAPVLSLVQELPRT